MFHIPSGTYLLLDLTASRIAELLVEEGDVGRVAQQLVSEFDVSMERALADVRSVETSVGGLTANRQDRGRLPTVTGAWAVTKGWARLPFEWKLAATKATAVVILVELGLRIMDLRRLSRLLGVPLVDESTHGHQIIGERTCYQLESKQDIHAHWGVEWVLDKWLFDGTCLRQALAFGWFERKKGPRLRIGLISDGTLAHAWLEIEGSLYNFQPTIGAFSPLPNGFEHPKNLSA